MVRYRLRAVVCVCRLGWAPRRQLFRAVGTTTTCRCRRRSPSARPSTGRQRCVLVPRLARAQEQPRDLVGIHRHQRSRRRRTLPSTRKRSTCFAARDGAQDEEVDGDKSESFVRCRIVISAPCADTVGRVGCGRGRLQKSTG